MSTKTDKSNLKREEILSWDYEQSLVKLGEPLSCDTFSMFDITEFRIELLNFLPQDADLRIRELTFETDSSNNLTIWYIEKEEKWQPVHFMKWNKDAQF